MTALLQHRLTRKEAARRLGLTVARIEKTERGENEVTLETLAAYSRAFPEAKALAAKVLAFLAMAVKVKA